MTDKLIHKEYIGSVHYSNQDETFYGKIEGITDLITFEGQTVKELKKAFKEAIEDYIELCSDLGKPAMRSFKGSFNVRISPQLHGRAFEKATLKGKSLNQFVQEAIEKEVTAN